MNKVNLKLEAINKVEGLQAVPRWIDTKSFPNNVLVALQWICKSGKHDLDEVISTLMDRISIMDIDDPLTTHFEFGDVGDVLMTIIYPDFDHFMIVDDKYSDLCKDSMEEDLVESFIIAIYEKLKPLVMQKLLAA
ncbi:hypothetical protein [Ekhidna sp.]|uniref:hypothetical protein n=1 Tax=Ekhidna sp. TaxID=2608089 RepID=UPI0032987BA0